MLRKSSLFILFFISYLPLFVILFIQNLHLGSKPNAAFSLGQMAADNLLPLLFLGFSVLAVLLYLVVFSFIRNYGFRTPEKIVKVKNTGIEYLSYLGTYIIPFIGMKFDTTNNAIATWVLIAVIGFIYPKTNLIYANPTLALFGFNIYKVNLEKDPDEEVVIITKEKIKKNRLYRLREMTEDIFFAKT